VKLLIFTSFFTRISHDFYRLCRTSFNEFFASSECHTNAQMWCAKGKRCIVFVIKWSPCDHTIMWSLCHSIKQNNHLVSDLWSSDHGIEWSRCLGDHSDRVIMVIGRSLDHSEKKIDWRRAIVWITRWCS